MTRSQHHDPDDGWLMAAGELLGLLESELAADEHDERRLEERPAEPPPRKAIISIHGQDVEECEVPVRFDKRRAA